jgi:protein-S-isoprenylcysteine O-methyltransferase Ste14
MIHLIIFILLLWSGFELLYFFQKISSRVGAQRIVLKQLQVGFDFLIFGTQAFVTINFFLRQLNSAPVPPTHPLLAGLLIGCGLLLRWYAIQILGNFFTADIAVFKSHPIVEAGPYKLLRHPQYLGGWITFLGAGFLCPAPEKFLVWGIPLLAFSAKIYWEEKALAQVWGEKYLNYRQRNWCVIPYLI